MPVHHNHQKGWGPTPTPYGRAQGPAPSKGCGPIQRAGLQNFGLSIPEMVSLRLSDCLTLVYHRIRTSKHESGVILEI